MLARYKRKDINERFGEKPDAEPRIGGSRRPYHIPAKTA